MSNDTKNGGPAFPALYFDLADNERGMNLRDYFAAKALQGLCASFPNVVKNNLASFANEAPRIAYEFADAMLKARETPNA